MVTEENTVPAYFIQTVLPLRKILLQRNQRHLLRIPLKAIFRIVIQADVLKLENHVELCSVGIGIFLCFLQGDTCGFSYRN